MVSGAVVANLTRPLARRGAVFDGVDDFVDVPHNINQLADSLSNGFTLSAWVNSQSLGESGGKIIDKSTGSAGNNGFTLQHGAINNLVLFTINGGTFASTGNQKLIPNTGWHHVLVTISSGQLVNIYLDGILTGSANQDVVQTISTITTTGDLRIGNRAIATLNTWDGALSKIQMWNRVLNSTEIANDLIGVEITDSRIVNVPLDSYDGVTNSGSRLTAWDDQVMGDVSGARVTASDQYMIAVHGDKILTTVVEEAP